MRKGFKADKEEFFCEVTDLCNKYVDKETVKDVYYAAIKVISKRLREDEQALMPDYGRFYVHNTKPRLARQVNSMKIINIPSVKTVKFDPDYKLKGYFRALS